MHFGDDEELLPFDLSRLNPFLKYLSNSTFIQVDVSGIYVTITSF